MCLRSADILLQRHCTSKTRRYCIQCWFSKGSSWEAIGGVQVLSLEASLCAVHAERSQTDMGLKSRMQELLSELQSTLQVRPLLCNTTQSTGLAALCKSRIFRMWSASTHPHLACHEKHRLGNSAQIWSCCRPCSQCRIQACASDAWLCRCAHILLFLRKDMRLHLQQFSGASFRWLTPCS